MFPRNLIRWSLAIAGMTAVDCAKPECDVDGTPTVCNTMQDPNGGLLTLSSRRVNMMGDRITVTMGMTTQVGDAVSITQLDRTPLSVGPLTTTGEVVIPTLGRFNPGEAQLVIGANKPEPIRLYRDPVFVATSPMEIVSTDRPLWVGIGESRKLLMLGDTSTTSTPIRFLEYNIDNPTPPFSGERYQNRVIRAATAPTVKFSAQADSYASPPDTVLLKRCPIGISDCAEEIQTPYRVPKDLTVSRAGDLLAVVADTSADAYFIGAGFSSAQPVSLAANNPLLIAAGDINADGKADLVVWNGATLSAFKQGSLSFALDDALSSQLEAARGADSPNQILIQDMDGDGLEDVVYSLKMQVTWLTNQGKGPDGKITFAKRGTPLMSPSEFVAFSVGDLDGDSKVDLAFAVASTRNLLRYFINKATY